MMKIMMTMVMMMVAMLVVVNQRGGPVKEHTFQAGCIAVAIEEKLDRAGEVVEAIDAMPPCHHPS